MHLLLVVFLVAFTALPGNKGKNQTKADNASREIAQQASTARPISAGVEQPCPCPAQTTTQKKEPEAATEPKPFMSHGEWVMAILTAIYVGLTGLYVYYAHRTFKALEKQIQIIEKQEVSNGAQLEVAQKSVAAYIAAERPFVMIELRGNDPAQFWAVNHGKSPAHIVFCNFEPFVYTPKLEELPDKLNYGYGFDMPGSEQINVQWIPPKGEMYVGSFRPAIIPEFGEDIINGLKTAVRVLLVYSAIKYRGIDESQTYVSTWCYRRFGGELRMWGSYGWNRYT